MVQKNVKTILQDRMSELYFNAVGHWVKDPEAAFSFKNCGRAVDYCLRHGLWGTRVILMLEPHSQVIVMTLEEPPRSQLNTRLTESTRIDVY